MARTQARFAIGALAAGLTLGGLLAMPDTSGQAAGTTAPLTASAASAPLPGSLLTSYLLLTGLPEAPVVSSPAAAAAPQVTTTAEAPPGPSATPVAALQPVGAVSGLTASGIPATALDAYRRAAEGAPCSVDWTLLAAIGRVESNHGRFGGSALHTDGLSAPPIL